MGAEISSEKTRGRASVYGEGDHAAQAYLWMLWGAFAFASMGALGHLAGERCSWQLGMTRAFALGHPSKVAVVGLTQIVFACLFDVIIWKHHFDALTILGILLVIAPTAWLLTHNPLRRSAHISTT
jgi:drug/metabolite transporter (DMT)-like permease